MANNIATDTIQLKELLNKAEDTGQIAWRIGEIALRVKDNDNFRNFKNRKYNKFEEYTLEELNKSENTINIYIKICISFELEEVDTMLFTHLKEFVRIKNETIRKIALQTFRSLKNKYIKSENLADKEQVFTASEIEKVAKIISIQPNLREDEVKTIIQEVLKVKNHKEATKANKFGKEFQFTNFEEIKELISCEPIDEQGTVALFCLIFSRLKEYSINLLLEKTTKKISFSKIKFVRSRFPDACIICEETKNNKLIMWEVMVEFEFMSESYTEHLISKEPCQLIICWQNNINREIYKRIPPIISLKKFLETGKLIIE